MKHNLRTRFVARLLTFALPAALCSMASSALADPACPGEGDPCAVGEGACVATGTFICQEGVAKCDALPRLPTDETCDGIDNDCDGAVDEDYELGEPCTSGEGACAAYGVLVCSVSGVQVCSATAGQPSFEKCDGLDNDCDGVVDNGFDVGEDCVVGLGECQSLGIFLCDGEGGVACSATAHDPKPEACDGLDNDCDGVTDDGFDVGASCAMGVGACRMNGFKVCSATALGGTVCDAVPAKPRGEVCDGIDNDCDGVVDDGFELGSPCDVGVGACQAHGVLACGPTGAAVCVGQVGEPSPELCDGIDNDCDGVVDDGLDVGGPCLAGVGACQAHGVIVCSATGAAVCTAPVGQPSAELCDGIDNDCDGVKDEGFPVGAACSAGVGACKASGHVVCDAAGGVACTAVAGEPAGTDLCDGIDNDCDGVIDQGCADGDNDGLSDAAEDWLGTDKADADSDDDGVLDGHEVDLDQDTDTDGKINALDPDSDGDGLFDGTELGLDCSGPDTDASAEHCIADADAGKSKTSPVHADSDGGSLSDGVEDANHDGAVDEGELDPTDGTDDVVEVEEKPSVSFPAGGVPVVGFPSDIPEMGCREDAECGGEGSGLVCDEPSGDCVDGCRDDDGCPDEMTCVMPSGEAGQCEPLEVLVADGNGPVCSASPARSPASGWGVTLLLATAAIALARRRRTEPRSARR